MGTTATLRRGGARAGRRLVHLLLGGVLALPYAGVAALFVVSAGRGSTLLLVALAVVAVVVAGAVAVVPAVRVLAVVAARSLLDVDLPDPTPGAAASWTARRRSTGWLALNAVLGAVTVLAVLILVPQGVSLVLLPVSGETITWFDGSTWTPAGWALPAMPLLGLVVLTLLVSVVVALGTLLARAAPALLGPTPSETLVLARARADRLARQARLAAELHDSVGHVLTAVTLQAGAARRVFDTDPAFVARALAAIEEQGRGAVDDLDRVLGLLRDDRTDAPHEVGLERLDELCDGVRATGTEVHVHRDADPTWLPAEVSVTAYGVVREALTNAARHGGGGPVDVAVSVDLDTLRVEVVNPGAGDGPRDGIARRRGGRGLRGFSERVGLVGGTLTAGSDGTRWTVRAVLPLGRTRSDQGSTPIGELDR